MRVHINVVVEFKPFTISGGEEILPFRFSDKHTHSQSNDIHIRMPTVANGNKNISFSLTLDECIVTPATKGIRYTQKIC